MTETITKPAKKPFIDAHHHLWSLDRLPYVWLKQKGKMKPFGDPTPIQRDYRLDELRNTDAKGSALQKSVHLQCDPGLADPVAETAFVQSVSDESGFMIGIVGYADLTRKDAPGVIERHTAYPNFRGIRQIVCRTTLRPELNFTTLDLMAHPDWQANLKRLAGLNLRFDLQLYPEQMRGAARVFARVPALPVAVNHCGCPFDLSPDGLKHWKQSLSHLAELEQVHIKFSGLGMYDRAWNAAKYGGLFEDMLALFGPERIMFGSNFPVDKLMRPYADILHDFNILLAPLSDREQEQILYENANRFYGL